MGTCEPFLSSSRRQFLRNSYLGLGSLALLDVLSSEAARAGTERRGGANAENPLRARPQQLPAKAKRCIFLFMEGGVSQMDTFDYKPALWKYAGQPVPRPKNTVGEIATFAAAPNRVIAPFWRFNQHGQSGRWMSELLPHLATCADDLAFLHGVKVDNNNHPRGLPHADRQAVSRQCVGRVLGDLRTRK